MQPDLAVGNDGPMGFLPTPPHETYQCAESKLYSVLHMPHPGLQPHGSNYSLGAREHMTSENNKSKSRCMPNLLIVAQIVLAEIKNFCVESS